MLLEGKKAISKNFILLRAIHVIYMIMGGPSGSKLLALFSDHESLLSEAVYFGQTNDTSSLNSLNLPTAFRPEVGMMHRRVEGKYLHEIVCQNRIDMSTYIKRSTTF